VVRVKAETCKGTLGPASRRNIPDVYGTGSECECGVLEGVLEMDVVGCEGAPAEESTAAVGVSAYVGAKMIAEMGFTLLWATRKRKRK
jgi:hypothetical protein